MHKRLAWNQGVQHYDVEEARSYTGRTRIAQIQRELTARALELLELPAADQCANVSIFLYTSKPNDRPAIKHNIVQNAQAPLLLDIGCGSGLSGEVLTEAGYDWLGLDIAPAMLRIAQQNQARGDLILADIGQSEAAYPTRHT